jgi:hypothetical protein
MVQCLLSNCPLLLEKSNQIQWQGQGLEAAEGLSWSLLLLGRVTTNLTTSNSTVIITQRWQSEAPHGAHWAQCGQGRGLGRELSLASATSSILKAGDSTPASVPLAYPASACDLASFQRSISPRPAEA